MTLQSVVLRELRITGGQDAHVTFNSLVLEELQVLLPDILYIKYECWRRILMISVLLGSSSTRKSSTEFFVFIP